MPNSTVELRRDLTGKTFTIGRLYANNQFIGRTLEYPWRNDASWNEEKTIGENFRHTSCVKPGEYSAFIRFDHLTGKGDVDLRVELTGGTRSYIQFHTGNKLIHMPDKSGNIVDSKGCILVGERIHLLRGLEPSIESSRVIINKFVAAVLGENAKSIKTSTDWGKYITQLQITVHIKGLPLIH